jgi:hypothetical protein
MRRFLGSDNPVNTILKSYDLYRLMIMPSMQVKMATALCTAVLNGLKTKK